MKSYQLLLATLLFALSSVPDLRAQQKATPAPVPAAAASTIAVKPAAEEESTPVANNPAAQGIKIHGHWVLQVMNADGTKGERREFENALTTVGSSEISGDQILGLLLSGNAVTSDPGIGFSNNTATDIDMKTLCLNTDGKLASGGPGCGILTTAASLLAPGSPLFVSGSTAQTGLTMLFTASPTVSWVLSGTYMVVASQTTIGTVQTLIGVCIAPQNIPGAINTAGSDNQNYFVGSSADRIAQTSPSTCDIAGLPGGTAAPRVGTLTSTLVAPALTGLTAGQLIQVTVTISFS